MTAAAVGAATTLGYRPGLDGLRGLAVAIVVASHLAPPDWWGAGRVGVSIFLTLSGFLITKLLLEERDRGGVSLAGFYRRRAARLLPALPAVLLVCSAVNAARGLPVAAPLLASAAYVQNVQVAVAGNHGSAFDHLWSLALEEQFYLLWPLALVLASPRRLFGAAVAGVPVLLAARVALVGTGAAGFGLSSGFLRVDALLAGCALAFVVHSGRRLAVGTVGKVAAWGLIALLSSVLMADHADFANTYGGTLTILATLALIVVALQADRPLWGGLGKISYGVYLWHVPFLILFGNPVLVVAATLAAAAASYRFVEMPARRWLSSRTDVRAPHRRHGRIKRAVSAVQMEVDGLDVVGRAVQLDNRLSTSAAATCGA